MNGPYDHKICESLRARVTELEAMVLNLQHGVMLKDGIIQNLGQELADLREKASWNIECQETLYEDSPWPIDWYLAMVKRQRENRKAEFYATTNKALRDLRAAIGEE